MGIALWLAAVVILLAAAVAAWILWQFRRWRNILPRPAFKQPRLRPDVRQWDAQAATATWIGHSTVYLNLGGVRILTDPMFSRRAGLQLLRLVTIGVSRHTAPALHIEQLRGKVDVILLSHAHMDHLDLPSLRALQSVRTQVVTAPGTSRLLRRMRFAQVTELGGDEELSLALGVRLTAVPVRHWGRRFPWNKDHGYTGYLLEVAGVRVFFAGDTAYTESFAQLRNRGPIDVAFLPIGAYSPDSFQGSHCTPEQAWRMFLDCGATWLAPMHWDTFVLSEEPVDEPLQRLLAMAGPDASRIVLREQGETLLIRPDIASNRPPDEGD